MKMIKLSSLVIIFIVFFHHASSAQIDTSAVLKRIDSINASMKGKGYQWTAGVTPISFLPRERFMRLLEPPVDTTDWSKQVQGKESVDQAYGTLNTGPNCEGTPINWLQYMSRVQNQDTEDAGNGCGDCWAHAATGVTEGLMQYLLQGVPGEGIQLDEFGMASDNDRCEGNCSGGSPSMAFDYMLAYKLWSKHGRNQFPNYDHAYYTISSYSVQPWNNNQSQQIIDKKKWLSCSPIAAHMDVWTDFPDYHNGVYQPSPYAQNTGFTHDIVIVGYNDDQQCWICKNSYGWDWGEKEQGDPDLEQTHKGYIRIHYLACHIDFYGYFTAVVDNLSDFAKIIPNFQNATAALNSSFVNNEWAYVLSSQTVNAGTTLTVPPGAYVAFAGNTSLNINGTLNAIGTSSQPITFSSISPSTWNGIYIASGAQGDVEYATVNSVNSYGGAAITANGSNNVQIKYSTIQNNTGACNGISILQNSSVWLHHNTINNNSHHGVYIYSSSPTLTQNNITANTNTGNAAVVCASSSSPVFGDLYHVIPGQNTLTGGYYGIYASYYGYPLFGSSGNNFQNRIFGNSYADAYAEMSSTLYAQNCWWGQSPPNTSKIITTSGGIIYYNPWLTSDPGPASMTVRSFSSFESPVETQQYTSSASDLRAILLEAREARLNNDYTSAINLYKSILSGFPKSDEAIIALNELGNVYREQRDPAILTYIGSYNTPLNPLRPIALEAIAGCYIFIGNVTQASAIDLILINEFVGTIHEKTGRLNEFFLSYNTKQLASASNQLSALTTKYPNDDAVATAQWLMNGTDQEASLANQSVTSPSADIGMGRTSLCNYPNPFNPITEIKYNLPSDSHVSLKIFNILGEEVKTLIDQIQNAGSKSVTFDGEKLSSGVYYARLLVTDGYGRQLFIATEKLLLMK